MRGVHDHVCTCKLWKLNDVALLVGAGADNQSVYILSGYTCTILVGYIGTITTYFSCFASCEETCENYIDKVLNKYQQQASIFFSNTLLLFFIIFYCGDLY